MDQKKVWDNISEEWANFRKTPIKEVINFLKPQTGRILDLGSGAGRHLIKVKQGRMYLVDFSPEMIKLAKKKAKINSEFFVSELTDLPFKDNYFDSAIYICTLHCIKGKRKRKKSLEELYRVLKPKARFMISVWKRTGRIRSFPKEKYIKWGDKGLRYYYFYELEELGSLLKRIGFKIIKSWENQNIFFIAEKD